LMPQAQTGVDAVARAARESKLMLSAVVVSDSLAADAMRAGTGATRQVGGRLFVLRDSTWTDLAHGDSLRVVRVAAFSDAYFALLRALPELAKPAALQPAVLVAGRRVSIKIESGGTTAWRDGELAALVRDFRP